METLIWLVLLLSGAVVFQGVYASRLQVRIKKDQELIDALELLRESQKAMIEHNELTLNIYKKLCEKQKDMIEHNEKTMNLYRDQAKLLTESKDSWKNAFDNLKNSL
jgi:hypothetical protein